MPTEIKTLGDALPEEIKRCEELLGHYKELGPVGDFGHRMISMEIDFARQAIADGDCVEMLKAYERLKECK